MKQASLTKTLLVPAALGLMASAGLAFAGCNKKDEAPPPMPSAEEEPTAPEALELAAEEDAGEGDADAAKATGPWRPKSSLTACCAALRQNAASAPAPTNTYMLAAAGVCDGMAGADRAAALAAIRGALRGSGLPAACQ